MTETFPKPEQERTIEYPDIAEEILNMAEEEQELREKIWDNPTDEGRYQIRDMDARNTARMKEIISRIGWPSVSKVGEEGAHMAWLLVQHADEDPAFQKSCLELMKGSPANEVSSIDVAYLDDRVMVKETGKQKYGTQFWTDEAGVYGPRPIEDEEHVENRRAEMGMEPFEENKARMLRRITDQKGKQGKP